jgi:hypothetical protein
VTSSAKQDDADQRGHFDCRRRLDRVEVSHMSSCIGGAFHGGFQTSGPLINDREKSRIRLFDIPALVENPTCFDEGYLPSRDEQ